MFQPASLKGDSPTPIDERIRKKYLILYLVIIILSFIPCSLFEYFYIITLWKEQFHILFFLLLPFNILILIYILQLSAILFSVLFLMGFLNSCSLSREAPVFKGNIIPISVPIELRYKPANINFNESTISRCNGKIERDSYDATVNVSRIGESLLWKGKIDSPDFQMKMEWPGIYIRYTIHFRCLKSCPTGKNFVFQGFFHQHFYNLTNVFLVVFG